MSKPNSTLTAERIREILDFSPDTGLFTWKKYLGARKRNPESLTKVSDKGYIRINIDGVRYRAHRLAWLHVHGIWPKEWIDHINGQKSDNRICNLRESTHTENMQNLRIAPKQNLSGLLGAQKDYKGNYKSTITINGKKVYLGYFPTKELAHEAYVAAKRLHHSSCSI